MWWEKIINKEGKGRKQKEKEEKEEEDAVRNGINQQFLIYLS